MDFQAAKPASAIALDCGSASYRLYAHSQKAGIPRSKAPPGGTVGGQGGSFAPALRGKRPHRPHA
jgi:hypothetical protein